MSYVKQDLYNLIKDLFGVDKVPIQIVKQVNSFIIDDGMNFKEIARCLVYWVEVRKQPLRPECGIAIVRSIKDQAAAYFHNLEKEKEEREKAARRVVEIQNNNIVYNIKKVKSQRRKIEQLDLSEIQIGDVEDDR